MTAKAIPSNHPMGTAITRLNSKDSMKPFPVLNPRKKKVSAERNDKAARTFLAFRFSTFMREL